MAEEKQTLQDLRALTEAHAAGAAAADGAETPSADVGAMNPKNRRSA